MPIYEVMEASYINDEFVVAGRKIEYVPPPGTTVGKNLRLVKGPIAVAAAEAELAKAEADLKAATGG